MLILNEECVLDIERTGDVMNLKDSHSPRRAGSTMLYIKDYMSLSVSLTDSVGSGSHRYGFG